VTDTTDATEGPTLTRSQVVARVAGTVFAVGVFSMWLYAFFIYDPGLKIDELADRTFPTAAEGICAVTAARLEALPPAYRAVDAAERADVVDQANVELRSMVQELRAVVPTAQGQVTTGISEWLDDWEVYIGDRQVYADGLRADDDTRFTETVKANRQISRAIDGFAEVNRMESCTTPGDVG
jgi:hypothetical protein